MPDPDEGVGQPEQPGDLFAHALRAAVGEQAHRARAIQHHRDVARQRVGRGDGASADVDVGEAEDLTEDPRPRPRHADLDLVDVAAVVRDDGRGDVWIGGVVVVPPQVVARGQLRGGDLRCQVGVGHATREVLGGRERREVRGLRLPLFVEEQPTSITITPPTSAMASATTMSGIDCPSSSLCAERSRCKKPRRRA